MRPVTPFRIIGMTILAAGAISFLARVISDFDNPPEWDPHDMLRGIGVWVAAFAIACLSERVYLRKAASTQRS